MKNTTKRIVSILLVGLMLISVMSVSAFATADDAFFTAHPQDASCENGGTLTFSVSVEGEYESLDWYLYDPESESYLIVEDSLDGWYESEGLGTATLTLRNVSCVLDGYEIECDLYTENGYEESEYALITVEHAALELVYDAETHLSYCLECGSVLTMEPHDFEDETCKDCGYNEMTAVERAPIILSTSEANAYCGYGDSLLFEVEAYGLGLTYQWYYKGDSRMSPLAENEHISGVDTAILQLSNVTCQMEGDYSVFVSNTAGTEIESFTLNVNHMVEKHESDAFEHRAICYCGAEMFKDYHGDSDCDGVCDECEYVFADGAPKITAQPKDLETVNGHEDLTVSVTATGENLTYTWSHSSWDQMDLSGTDTATVTIKSVYDPENGVYDCCNNRATFRCVIINDKGAVSTEWVSYEVEHAEVVETIYWNDYYHDLYCVCNRWIEDTYHFDADLDGSCDGCDGEMFELFDDVTDPTVWYYDAAVYGKEKGIFMGAYGKLLPDDQITRGEVATVLARIAIGQDMIDELDDAEFEQLLDHISEAMGVTPVEFTDIEGKFYERHARVAAAFGFINGYENGTFRGEDDITREELATVLMRMIYLLAEGDISGIELENPVEAFNDADKVSDWAVEYVEDARSIGLFCGDENVNFNPQANATRAEVAQTMMRMYASNSLLLYLIGE